MAPAFRFLQASDLHLERVPRGLAEVPDHLRAALIDAPYRAAQRIFETALKERVDFLLLAGDVLAPRAAGPRALVFLSEQFQRMSDGGVAVYWAGGRSDDFEHSDDWPLLCAGVHRFASHAVERIVHTRQGEPLVEILGLSNAQRRAIRAADFRGDAQGLFTVAMTHGAADADELAGRGVHYWALGGQHHRQTLLSGPVTAHYCGTPQGRRPQESGPRGCTLVSVDAAGQARLSLVATDSVRYLQERVEVGPSTTAQQLYEILGERIAELSSDPFGPELLVNWSLLGSPALAADLRHGKLGGDLLARLRAEHGAKRPAIWTVAIEPHQSTACDEALFEEQSVLGEFLRVVRHYADQPDEPLSLESYLAERHVAGTLGESLSLGDAGARRRVLAEVARLGVELLGGRESRP